MAEIPSSDTLSRVVRWAIILFFAYALWHSSVSTPPLPAPTNQVAAKEKDCDKKPEQNFPALSLPFLPAILPAALHIEDTKEGTGAPAVCGQYAQIDITYMNKKGEVTYRSAPIQRATNIGEDALLAPGIVGMKAGGERTITVPPASGFAGIQNVNNEGTVAKVSLLSLTPLPESLLSPPMPVRMIDTRFGNGPRAECGDTVTANITIWKLDGTKLFSTKDSKPVTFALGNSVDIPYGIEQGAMGMMEGSERTLIMPPAFTEPLIQCLPTRPCLIRPIPVQFPPHEMVLVEMTRLPDVKEPAATPEKKKP